MRQVGTERNDNYLFPPFSSFFNLWWLEMEPYWYFLIFLNFFGIFYYALGRNETERQYLFFFFLDLFQPILAWNEAHTGIFQFFEFFWNFKLCVRKERNEMVIFLFSLSLPFPNYFGLKWCHNGIFLFFLLFFCNFLLCVR